jgi:hypothetical protein
VGFKYGKIIASQRKKDETAASTPTGIIATIASRESIVE